jgi:hypothetical protein
MRKIVDPKQTHLFDPYDNVLTEKTRKRLLDGWAGVFRRAAATGQQTTGFSLQPISSPLLWVW